MKKVLAACTMAFVLAPAHATTFSSIAIGETFITLDDLSAADAVTPGYVAGGPFPEEFHWHLRPAPVSSQALGQAEITRDDVRGVAGRTYGPSSSFLAIGDRYGAARVFSVSPNTRVTISTPYALETSIDGEPIGTGDPPQTFASFQLSLIAANNLSFDEARGLLQYDLLPPITRSASIQTSLEAPVNGRWSDSGVLTASFDNASDGEAIFAFHGQMVGWGRSVAPSPVPEPSALALLLAGIGIVGAAARRRVTAH